MQSLKVSIVGVVPAKEVLVNAGNEFEIDAAGLVVEQTYTVRAEENTGATKLTTPVNGTIIIKNIARLQYLKAGTWTDLPEVLYTAEDSTVQFKAIPAPGMTLPANKPTWSAAGATFAAGIPVTGDTTTATFGTTSTTTTDLKTVTASGVGIDNRPAKIVVWQVSLLRGVNGPDR